MKLIKPSAGKNQLPWQIKREISDPYRVKAPHSWKLTLIGIAAMLITILIYIAFGFATDFYDPGYFD